MHSHDFKPYQIDRNKSLYSKIGYVYSKCSCEAVKGEPIVEGELKSWEEQVSELMGGMY